MYFDAGEFVAESQQRSYGQAFRKDERWRVTPDRHEITLLQHFVGPGHDSSQSIVFLVK